MLLGDLMSCPSSRTFLKVLRTVGDTADNVSSRNPVGRPESGVALDVLRDSFGLREDDDVLV